MSISKIRSLLYGSARVLGDVQAISKSVATGSAEPVAKRILRREAGRLCGHFMRWLIP